MVNTKNTGLRGRLSLWWLKHYRFRQFILLLSFVCGLVGGLIAVALKGTVHFINHFLTHQFQIENANLWYLAYPLVGILLTVIFVKFFIKENITHGVSHILHAISRRKSLLKPHNTHSSLIGSVFTVGFGGSVGLEAPIVLTGASIGSNIGRFFRMSYKNNTLLIGCGAAGALAGIFKAPIAAVVFSLEVLMLDLTMWSIIPLLISAVTGAIVAKFLMGENVLFSFSLQEEIFLDNILWYIVLGVVSGVVSLYVIRTTIFFEDKLSKLKNPFLRVLTGGLILGLLIFIFPPLYGEGYDTLTMLLHGKADALLEGSLFYPAKEVFGFLLIYLGLIMLFKVVAMAMTNGSGGVGGIFAPALFIGGVLGYLCSGVLNKLGFVHVSPENFALVGMSGIMAGVMHAPLTGIFLIAEITGGYELFIPLIVTSTISFITIRYFEPNSIYTRRLAMRGDLITHHKDKAVLTLMEMENVIENNFLVLKPEFTLGELVKVIKKSRRNVFPVVDDRNYMVGVLTLNDLRDIMFEQELYDQIKVNDIMYFPETYVSYYDSLEQIVNKIEATGRFNVPVLKDGIYLGFISRAKVFSMYRKMIKDFSDE